MTWKEAYDRKNRAESAISYIEFLGETSAEADAIKEAVRVIEEYIEMLNDIMMKETEKEDNSTESNKPGITIF